MNSPNQSGRDPGHPSPTERGRDRHAHLGRRKGNRLARNTAGGAALVVLLGLYAFAQPILNERLGWSLPELRSGVDGEIAVVDAGQSAHTAGPLAKRKPPASPVESPVESSVESSVESPVESSAKDEASSTDSDSGFRYGLLREIAPDRYLSPAGLLYTPGSSEGHRLEHLRRHTEDQPSRPGSHGVFDGDMPGALATIDRAYEMAKQNQRTTKRIDGQRMIYTVDMGGRVGYVGGRHGREKKNPMARRVRMVLEGTRVITAYPM